MCEREREKRKIIQILMLGGLQELLYIPPTLYLVGTESTPPTHTVNELRVHLLLIIHYS